jgi:hypothetical protein
MVGEPIATSLLWVLIAIALMGSTATDFGRFLLSLQALSREGPVLLVLAHIINLVRHMLILHQQPSILIMAGIRNTLKTTLAIPRTCSNTAVHSIRRCMERLVLLVLDQAPCILMGLLRLSHCKGVLYTPELHSMVIKHHSCTVLLLPV